MFTSRGTVKSYDKLYIIYIMADIIIEQITHMYLLFDNVPLMIFILYYPLSLAAKLGDTKELEDFIANLDKTLESKCKCSLGVTALYTACLLASPTPQDELVCLVASNCSLTLPP